MTSGKKAYFKSTKAQRGSQVYFLQKGDIRFAWCAQNFLKPGREFFIRAGELTIWRPTNRRRALAFF